MADQSFTDNEQYAKPIKRNVVQTGGEDNVTRSVQLAIEWTQPSYKINPTVKLSGTAVVETQEEECPMTRTNQNFFAKMINKNKILTIIQYDSNGTNKHNVRLVKDK